jgi:hypothetical protein
LAVSAFVDYERRGPGERLVGRARAIDGDTLTVAGITLRLQGIAACGADAAAFMLRLVNGKTLICDLTDERTHGREVGVCRLTGAMWRPRSSAQASPATVRASPAGATPASSGQRLLAISRAGPRMP